MGIFPTHWTASTWRISLFFFVKLDISMISLIEPSSLVELEKVDVDGDEILNDTGNEEDDHNFSYLDYLNPMFYLKSITKTISPTVYHMGILVSLKINNPGKVIVPIRERGKVIGYSIKGLQKQKIECRAL